MNKLEYIPGTAGAAAVGMDADGSFVGVAEKLRSREWSYKLGYRDVESANRPAREVSVMFNTDYATADRFRRAADADMAALTPGLFVAQGEWKQRGYIASSTPSYIHYGRLGASLGCILLDGAWWRIVSRAFNAENTVIPDRYDSATGESVVTVGADSAPLHALTVYGESVQDGTPTPDAPVPVQTVSAPNLLNERRMASDGGVTTLNADGTVTYNGTSTATGNTYFTSSTISGRTEYILLGAGTYTLSGGLPNGSSSTHYTRATCVPVGGGSTVRYSDYGNGVTFTLAEQYYVSVFAHIAANETFDNAVAKPMLVSGSTAKPYVPYGAIGIKVNDTITPVPLDGNVLASLPDGTRDVLNVDATGHVTVEKNVMRRIYDGSDDEGWLHYNYTAGHGYYLPTSSFSPVSSNRGPNMVDKALCNRFVVDGSDAACTSGEMYFDSNACPDFVYPAATTVEAWRTFLASNNVDLFYKPATHQTIDLGYIDMPNVFNNSIIEVVSEVTPTITAEWKLPNIRYLDYPFDYAYDYMSLTSGSTITPSVLTPSDVRLTIYGAVSNPYVIVGGNRYQVNVNVPAGGYLVVDGREKTITLVLADGTRQNVFGAGVRGTGLGGGAYIFEPIKGGVQDVQWSGAFGFELAWYEDEGEPPWSQS